MHHIVDSLFEFSEKSGDSIYSTEKKKPMPFFQNDVLLIQNYMQNTQHEKKEEKKNRNHSHDKWCHIHFHHTQPQFHVSTD